MALGARTASHSPMGLCVAVPADVVTPAREPRTRLASDTLVSRIPRRPCRGEALTRGMRTGGVMPSFDVVSKLQWDEVNNALNQAQREISQRFDFKGSGATLERTDK